MAQPLMGTSEVAERLGVTRQRVHQMVTSGVLPPPEATLSAGSIWRGEVIEEWVSEHQDQANGDHRLLCAFCGKHERDVLKLVSGPPPIEICNECIDLAAEIVLHETGGTGLTRVPAYYFLHPPIDLPDALAQTGKARPAS